MRRTLRGIIGIALALLLAHISAAAQEREPAAASGVITLRSAHAVQETERRLVQAIDSAGLKIAARIDHRANALGAGLDLPATVLLVFGNPRAGTTLMERQRSIGLDLPLKVLIWEEGGQTKLAYNDPLYLAARHGLDPANPVFAQVKAAMERFAAAATSP